MRNSSSFPSALVPNGFDEELNAIQPPPRAKAISWYMYNPFVTCVSPVPSGWTVYSWRPWEALPGGTRSARDQNAIVDPAPSMFASSVSYFVVEVRVRRLAPVVSMTLSSLSFRVSRKAIRLPEPDRTRFEYSSPLAVIVTIPVPVELIRHRSYEP